MSHYGDHPLIRRTFRGLQAGYPIVPPHYFLRARGTGELVRGCAPSDKVIGVAAEPALVDRPITVTIAGVVLVQTAELIGRDSFVTSTAQDEITEGDPPGLAKGWAPDSGNYVHGRCLADTPAGALAPILLHDKPSPVVPTNWGVEITASVAPLQKRADCGYYEAYDPGTGPFVIFVGNVTTPNTFPPAIHVRFAPIGGNTADCDVVGMKVPEAITSPNGLGVDLLLQNTDMSEAKPRRLIHGSPLALGYNEFPFLLKARTHLVLPNSAVAGASQFTAVRVVFHATAGGWVEA